MLTDEQAKALRALCDAATPGPWRAGSSDLTAIFGDPDNPETLSPGLGRCVARVNQWMPEDTIRADAAFIAAAREALPVLLDEQDRLRARLERATHDAAIPERAMR